MQDQTNKKLIIKHEQKKMNKEKTKHRMDKDG